MFESPAQRTTAHRGDWQCLLAQEVSHENEDAAEQREHSRADQHRECGHDGKRVLEPENLRDDTIHRLEHGAHLEQEATAARAGTDLRF